MQIERNYRLLLEYIVFRKENQVNCKLLIGMQIVGNMCSRHQNWQNWKLGKETLYPSWSWGTVLPRSWVKIVVLVFRFTYYGCYIFAFCYHVFLVLIHRVRKKRVYSILGITSSNIGRLSKFFHFRNLLEICNKAVVKYLTTPQTCHYTTLWNFDVQKLACPVHCGSFLKDKLARILTFCRQQLHFKMKPVYYNLLY